MTTEWQGDAGRPFRRFLSKVPEITAYFWIVRILISVVAGAVRDTRDLTLTTAGAIVALLIALAVQLRAQRYVPARYWLVMLLAGVVATLLVDTAVENLEIPPAITALGLALALAGTGAAWYRRERSLSLHTIDTPQREGFYWLAVLLAFALGAAVVPYAAVGALTGGILLVIGLVLRSVLVFWVAFVATGPVGGALGELVNPPLAAAVALGVITAVVAYLTVSHTDAPIRPLRMAQR